MSEADGGGVLAGITGPQDLRRLSEDELALLATEIRDFLVAKVSRTGGHLGPNLGVVELTLALHRSSTPPRTAFFSIPDIRHMSTRWSPVGRAASTCCAAGVGCPGTRTRASPSTT